MNQPTLPPPYPLCRWLVDAALRMVGVLALDRFNDFSGESAVAPVRETVAQALAAVVAALPPAAAGAAASAVAALGSESAWQIRQGAMLGLKYILAARRDLIPELLPKVLPAALRSLEDTDDDVRSCAAAALLPAVQCIASNGPSGDCGRLLELLWGSLMHLDDLSAATSSVMRLLADLLAHPQLRAASSAGGNLPSLLPRLFPYVRHPFAAVRTATAGAAEELFASVDAGAPLWQTPLLADLLLLAFQGLLFDPYGPCAAAWVRLWRQLCAGSPVAPLAAAATRRAASFVALACLPLSAPPVAATLLLPPFPSKDGLPGATAAAAAAAAAAMGGGGGPQLGAYQSASVSADSRSRATEALGLLLSALSGAGAPAAVSSLSAALVAQLSAPSAAARVSAAMALASWGFACSSAQPQPQPQVPPELELIRAPLYQILESGGGAGGTAFSELARLRRRLEEEVTALIDTAGANKWGIDAPQPEARITPRGRLRVCTALLPLLLLGCAFCMSRLQMSAQHAHHPLRSALCPLPTRPHPSLALGYTGWRGCRRRRGSGRGSHLRPAGLSAARGPDRPCPSHGGLPARSGGSFERLSPLRRGGCGGHSRGERK